MDKQPIGELMETTMSKIRELVDVDTVTGTPITTPDGIMIIPVSRVSFGFAAGASDLVKKDKPGVCGGNGGGVRIEPIGFLVVRDGSVRMLNIAPPPCTTVDRVIEMVPDIMDKVEGYVDKAKAAKAAKEPAPPAAPAG